MNRSRRIGLFVLLGICAFMVTGAVAAQDATPEVADECASASMGATEEAAAAADNSDVSFAIILPNPRGDRSFIDSAAAGAERAIAELGVSGTIVETAGAQEHDAAIRRAI